MARLLAIGLFLTAHGCALTAPEGSRELMADIERDRSTQQKQSDVFTGADLKTV